MSNKKFTLKFTSKAYEDIEEIYNYISGKLFAEVAANNLLEKIEERVMRLEEFPFSCNYVSDEVLKNKGYRKLFDQFKEKMEHYGLVKPKIKKSLYKQLSIEDYSFV